MVLLIAIIHFNETIQFVIVNNKEKIFNAFQCNNFNFMQYAALDPFNDSISID